MARRINVDEADNGFTIEIFDPNELGGKVKRLVAESAEAANEVVKGALGKKGKNEKRSLPSVSLDIGDGM